MFNNIFSKRRKVTFSDQDIISFCELTGDDNRIHNPDFMRGAGKRAIVPGMLSLAYAVSVAEKYVVKEGNTMVFYFTIPVCSGDTVTFSKKSLEEQDEKGKKASKVQFSAIFDEGNALGGDGKLSQAYYVKGSTTSRRFSETGDKNYFPVNPAIDLSQSLEVDEGLSALLYSIACSSRAALERIRDPKREEEKALNELIEKGKLPVYRSLSVQYKDIPRNCKGEIGISTKIKKTDRNILYNLLSHCYLGSTPLYTLTASVMVIPERKIISSAKDL